MIYKIKNGILTDLRKTTPNLAFTRLILKFRISSNFYHISKKFMNMYTVIKIQLHAH